MVQTARGNSEHLVGINHFAAAADATRPDVVRVFGRAWNRLGAPGATWNGAERIAIAGVARAARSHEPLPATDVPEAAVEAAQLMGGELGKATERWIVDTIAPAIGYAAYVEIVGLAAQLTAIDTYHRAMGLPLERLPNPRPGSATGQITDSARVRSSWVPTTGRARASVVYALSMVPGEMAGFEDLHGPLYVPVQDMGDLRFSRALDRSQMELVAARTSAINDCFY